MPVIEPQTERWHFPLTEFIAMLKNEHFSLGIDTHILMHRVIQQFDLPQQLGELPDYLAPIVAQSMEEQNKFHEYFKRWFYIEKIDIQTDIEKQETEKKDNGTSQEEDNQDTKTDKTQTRTTQQTDEKKRAVLNIEQGIMPSQGLSFAVPHTKVEFAPALLRHFRQWRFMNNTDRTFFDIHATVKRVTTQGDTADPVYKYQRKHVEYLMIVEQNTYKNHTAAFIKSIHSTLNNNNIDVLLFTFDTDPRILYTKLNRKKYTINQVFAQYSHAVLLYFGSASLWFDTQNYRIYPWTNLLKRWQQRYWFPDSSPDNWHLTEQTGSKIFPNVLPFSLDALKLLTNHFLQNSQTSGFTPEHWKNDFDYALTDVNTQIPLDVIALHFHPLVRVWIAACAVYPEVSWDLTLELGKILSHEEYNLCSAENILQLLRLDWFKLGYIPPEIRFALMETWLPPDVNVFVNRHIVKLMQSDACKDILQKHPAFRMQLAIHELLAETNEQKRNKIAEKLKKDIEVSGTADFVALQYINEAELSPVFFRLPDELLIMFERITGKKLKTKKEPFEEPEMVFVKGGTFMMGTDDFENAKPPHDVTVSNFYIGKYEVTIQEYMAFVEDTKGNKPEWLEEGNSYNINENGKDKDYYRKQGMSLDEKDKRKPITGVSWNNAVAYCDWLSKKTNKKYSLPSEAQWEYAAGGGVKYPINSKYAGGRTKWAGTNNESELGDYAWYDKNSNSTTHEVGTTPKANSLGIYDMSGNVWEWCLDTWHSNYENATKNGSAWIDNSSSGRVFRGGGWGGSASSCRVANRYYYGPTIRYYYVGFRLVRVP